jgi:predicted aspartyl protease
MPTVIGYLDKSGAPAIKLKISGLLPNSSQEFEVVIDTGFSGFVSLPILQAFPLGLVLIGTTTVTFADGSTGVKLTALGNVTVEGESKVGVIILEQGSTDVLVGMDFLKTFGISLFVHPPAPLIALVNDTDVQELIKQVAAATKPLLAGTAAAAAPALVPEPPPIAAPPAAPETPEPKPEGQE